MEKEIKEFLNRYNFDYYIGKIVGEELFSKMAGYLNPTKKWEDTSIDDLWHAYKLK